jgi:hypothetical protein
VLYCIHCEKFRFMRSHHCKELGVCVSRMDHYCAFLDNCIGRNNHRYFLQYLTYTYLLIAWIFFELLWTNRWISQYDDSRARVITLHCTLGVSGFFGLYVFVLWIGQVRRAFKNLTMIEEATGGIEVRIFFFYNDRQCGMMVAVIIRGRCIEAQMY